jgi:deazaflavin-dependent oxidoreductase (nitroreductase family)
MSTQPQTRGNPSRVGPVGPSLLVRLVLGPLTKMLNPLVGTLAGRRHVPMAQLHHIGRRTGRSYRTSVGARVRGDLILIPLTFGNQSDWARNVYEAGQCSVHVNGYTIRAEHPRFLAAADVAPLVHAMFNPVERVVFKTLGIKQFMRLEQAV